MNLSYPEGRRINDCVDSELCSLKYVRVDDVVRRLIHLGPGAEMAKINVKSAYPIVPVHPSDRPLLEVAWNGSIFVDAALTFGLRWPPQIFNAVADVVEWMARKQEVTELCHYLDDYITCGVPGSSECGANLLILKEMCSFLGIPLAEDKVEGPATCLVFLGIEINTVACEQQSVQTLR